MCIDVTCGCYNNLLLVILTRLRFNETNGIPHEIGFIAIKICLSEEESNERRPGFELLEADFFDDELIVVIYRVRSKDGK